MAKIRVQVLKDHPYSKGIKIGDTYEVSGQSQLALVKAMGWAKEAEAKPEAPAKNTYQTRDMTASRAVQAATSAPAESPSDPSAEPPSIFTRARRVVAKKAAKDEAPKAE